MAKKIFKAWFIIMGASWMLHGASVNALHIAQEQRDRACGNDEHGYSWGHIWPETIANFKETIRLMKGA